MSSQLRTVVMPDREEMLQALCRIDNQDVVIRDMYPILLQMAGSRQDGRAIADKVAEAIATYTDGMDLHAYLALMMRARQFVKALIIDPDVLKDAYEYFDEIPGHNF